MAVVMHGFTEPRNYIRAKRRPWVGKVVIQGKHTNGLNRSFSEADFYSESNTHCVIAKELPRILALKVAGDLDHYMSFANHEDRSRRRRTQLKTCLKQSNFFCWSRNVLLEFGQDSVVVRANVRHRSA
jgi:hypothetical protein